MKRPWMLTLLLILAASAVFGATEESQKLRFRFLDSAGKPIPAEEVGRFHCRDMSDEPIPARTYVHEGYATVVLPDKPVQVCALIRVPEFGEVTIYADGNGKGYSKPGKLDFVTEAAATRLLRVRSALKKAESEGLRMPAEFKAKLDAAEKETPYKSLAMTLAAGEELALARARYRISKLERPRKGFLFGCNSFGHPARGPAYDQRFRELFNFATTHLYLSYYAPEEKRRDYARTDLETDWLRSMGMAVKPCPPFYLAGGVTPEWLKNRPYSEVRRIAHDLIEDVCARYAGKARFCEIVNEAHDYSNSLRLKPEELTDLAGVCSKAAREGDPRVRRIINCCHLWGEYAATPSKSKPPRRSPYAYLRDCIRSGVKFEIVGLQMYYPEYDLFETDRLLDRYSKLGKPIHVTEMGCSSAPGLDPNAQRKRATAGWHGPWTEEMQADWVEGIYTICYSKPYIQAVEWWDLADAVSFWPYGGLLRGDLSPKPAYLRLQGLLKKRGFEVGKQSPPGSAN